MHDLIIIGSGPAGVSAALTAHARDLGFLWFGHADLSAKIEKAERIRNYPGLPDVTGQEMKESFLSQIEGIGLTLMPGQVTAIYPMGNYYAVSLGQEIHEARAILLATGMETSKAVPGETELLGKGVSYCATCDGFLYKQKNIAVACTSPKFEPEIEYLADIASQVTVFAAYKGCGIHRENTSVIQGYPTKVSGEGRVQAISHQGQEIPVEGVFFLKDSISPAVLLNGLQMEGAHIQVDRMQRTNLKGCFAAGDCTGRPYQYAKAVGEGNVALHSILEYLSSIQEAP